MTDRAEGIIPWSPEISPNEHALGNEPFSWTSPEIKLPKIAEETDLTEYREPDHFTKAEVNKKRKIAHSVIEKNYRSRINTGLAELRRCVPSMLKSDSSRDLHRMDGLQDAEVAMQGHSSGKVEILSDAVQHVKSLELQNKALCGKLDVLQRRHDLLQKIALSKTGLETTTTDAVIQELAPEKHQPLPEAFSDLKTRKRRRKSPPARARPDQNVGPAVLDSTEFQYSFPRSPKVITNLLSPRKRQGSVIKLAIGTFAAIAVLEGLTEDETYGKMPFAVPCDLRRQVLQSVGSLY
jgi:hypothetical protein